MIPEWMSSLFEDDIRVALANLLPNKRLDMLRLGSYHRRVFAVQRREETNTSSFERSRGLSRSCRRFWRWDKAVIYCRSITREAHSFFGGFGLDIRGSQVNQAHGCEDDGSGDNRLGIVHNKEYELHI